MIRVKIVKFKTIRKIPEPKLKEISFSGNMPSPYEKKLRSDIKKTVAKERKKK